MLSNSRSQPLYDKLEKLERKLLAAEMHYCALENSTPFETLMLVHPLIECFEGCRCRTAKNTKQFSQSSFNSALLMQAFGRAKEAVKHMPDVKPFPVPEMKRKLVPPRAKHRLKKLQNKRTAVNAAAMGQSINKPKVQLRLSAALMRTLAKWG